MNINDIIEKLAQLAEDENAEIELSVEELEALHEHYEELDEISKKTLGSYIKNASNERGVLGGEKVDYATNGKFNSLRKTIRKDIKRANGIDLAVKKIAKESVAEDESEALHEISKKTLGSYIKKASKDYTDTDAVSKLTSKVSIQKKRLKGIHRAADKLAEGESEAAETLHPAAAPGDTKSEILAQLLALTPWLAPEDLSWLYTNAVKAFPEAVAQVSDDSAKNRASVAMKEDFEKVFEGQDLTEEFKSKAATIVEAAVSAKVSERIVELEEEYESALEEEINEITSELVEKLDAYLDHAVESYLEENAIAVESALKSEVTEDFLSGLKNLFAEHYIDMPESKVDVVEELAAKVSDLEESLDRVLMANAELAEDLKNTAKVASIYEASRTLSVTNAAKFESLAEGLEFDDLDSFEKKLGHLKEVHFSGKPKKESNILTEDFIEEDKDETLYTDETVRAYTAALGRTIAK
jgi:hypothetical protein